jgi:hypothetical protein
LNKLLLGSGGWDWPDWTRIDASPDSPATYHAAIPPLPAEVLASKWDVIMAIHFIEHLAPWKADELLHECYNMLTPNGVLILEQPNILYAAKVLLGQIAPLDGEPGQFDMWPLWGDPTQRDELMLHKWGYSPDTMTTLLCGCGFDLVNIVIKPTEYHGKRERDFRIEAIK